MKYLKTVMDTSRPTALYTKDNKDTIMVMIQTKEINQYFFKGIFYNITQPGSTRYYRYSACHHYRANWKAIHITQHS